MAKKSFKVLILGGGTGGISVAAKLSREIPAESIGIVEPADQHFYQPLWTLAGAGIIKKEESMKKMADLIPSGVQWVKESVIKINPENKSVELTNDTQINYEFLVVATGLILNWDKIEGLKGQIGQNGIGSVYHYDSIEYTQKQIEQFQGGKAVFVMPPTPIKCAGAPQKIMYLAEDLFRKRGVRHKCEVIFTTAGKAMFGIPVFSKALEEIVKNRDIHPQFQHKLVKVDASHKIATFDVTADDGSVSHKNIQYDFLHVVPTMSAHPFISQSELAFQDTDQKGWLAVNKQTLQHLKFPEIFGIGDVTGVPNSKTGAAIRKQYPIVVKNLIAVMNGQTPSEHYDGYSSCPLITEVGKVMLAEFGYDGKLMPSFPLDPAIPRRSYWHLKKDLLPLIYWNGMMKGWI